ncbi:MAG: hypothetical protein K0Q68_1121 [Moraxellaceae bacterium]|jgi:hypothetical protein|nr:hypothetical protein [Moraxellaceae bacterium]
MMRALVASFAFSLCLLLAACGGDSDGGSGAPAASGSVSSNVVKGLIRNGVVTAWRWRDGQYVRVATARTSDTGDFALEIPAPVPGEVLRLDLGLSGDTSAARRTEMLCDVAQCGSGVRGDWVPLTTELGLTSWVSVGEAGELTVMPMTPVSTLLVRYAENLGGGHLTAAVLDAARLRVAALFRMTPEQLLTRPGNIINALWLDAATPEAVKLSLLSAAFAELASVQGVTIQEVIASYVEHFIANDGHLVQADATASLGDLYSGVNGVVAAAGAPAVQAWVNNWITEVSAALQSGKLNTTACAPDCAPFDSNDFLNALGTSSDSLGGDLRRVMTEKNVDTLEELLAGELSRYGWLLGPDSTALAQVALQVVAVGALSSIGFPASSTEQLSLVQEGDVLHVDGSINGLLVDLDITIPQLLNMIQAYTPGQSLNFLFGAKGTVQNGRFRASIDGTLAIDATGTDFLPLKQAITAVIMAQMSGDAAASETALASALKAVADIIRKGEATFTLNGAAGLAKLELQGDALVETSRLAVEGNAWLHVNMDGRNGSAIAANGKVEHGRLALPNGDHFEVDPARGHFLRFALGEDGTAEVNFAANVLGHAASASGNGRLAALGPMLNNLRDGISAQVETLDLDLNGILAQLVEDFGQLALTVTGHAVIPDFGHTYTLTIADGQLAISQPGSTETALQVGLGGTGLMAQAGGKWWLLGIDLRTPGYPALTLLDSSGGDWRWEFDFTGVLVVTALPVVPVISYTGTQPPPECYGTVVYC